jgi:hypothetical protein
MNTADVASVPDINERTHESIERARRKREALVIKDWRNIQPFLEDTPEVRETWALGEAWRKAQTEP